MLSFVKKALMAASAVSAIITNVNQPGLAVSLTPPGANNAKNVIAPYLFGFLKDLKIAEVPFKGGFLKNLEVELPQPPLEDIDLKSNPSHNSVEIAVNGVNATITADFSYTYFITVTGKIDILITDIGMDFECGFGQ